MAKRARARTPADIEIDQLALFEARRVLQGESHPTLDISAHKLLKVLLTPPRGVDVVLSSDGLVVEFGARSGPSYYSSYLAPAAFAQLLTWAGVRSVRGELRAFLRMTDEDHVRRRSCPWTDGTRQLWLREEDSRIVLSIRGDSTDPALVAWPERLMLPPLPIPVFRRLDPPMSCPACGASIQQARALHRALICPFCFRSFAV